MTILCICVVIDIFLFYIVYCKTKKLKRQGGLELTGKKVGYKEIPGRPTRYCIRVDVTFGEEERRATILTSDKGARRLEKEENIPVIYEEKSNKLFWADEKEQASILSLVVWGVMTVGMLIITDCSAFAFLMNR